MQGYSRYLDECIIIPHIHIITISRALSILRELSIQVNGLVTKGLFLQAVIDKIF